MICHWGLLGWSVDHGQTNPRPGGRQSRTSQNLLSNSQYSNHTSSNFNNQISPSVVSHYDINLWYNILSCLSAKYENHFTRRKYGETQQRSALGQVSRIIKWCPLVLVKIEKPSGFLQTELQALVAFTGKSIFHGSPHWSVVTSMNTYQMTHKTSNALHTSNHDFSQSVKVDAKILMIIYQSFDIHMS